MNFRCRQLACLLAAVALPALPAFSAESDIAVSDAYVRLVPSGAPTTGAFMTLKNGGDKDRKLVKVDSPVAKTVELHNHINDNGVMRMRPVKEIEIKAKGEATLKPGSYHAMLIDLKQQLKEGDTVPVTLTFDDGSTRKVDAAVKKPQAAMPGGEHKH